MEQKHLVDIAYEQSKTKFEKKQFTFNNLWATLVKNAKLTEQEQKENMGSLYVDILQDPRFIFLGNNTWKLREFLTREEIAMLENSLYDFVQDAEMLESYDKDETEKLEDIGLDDAEDEYLDYKNKFKTNASDIDYEEANDLTDLETNE